jgi:serine/threonine protein kinase
MVSRSHAGSVCTSNENAGSPECFRRDSVDDSRNIIITTKADIWSFGCVLSEVCVWVVFGSSGPHGLREYRKRRQKHNVGAPRGANTFHLSGRESKAVLDEHAKVAAQSRCDPITAAILQLMPKMLHLDPERRPSAQELRKHFDDIINDARARVSRGGFSSVVANRTSEKSKSTTHSLTPSKPLGQRRNRRLTGSTGSGGPIPIDVAVGSGPMIPGALQTETPRTLTLEGDTHHIQHDVRLPSISTAEAAEEFSQKLSQIETSGHTTANLADTVRTPPFADTPTNAQQRHCRGDSTSTVRSVQSPGSRIEDAKSNDKELIHNNDLLLSPGLGVLNGGTATDRPDDLDTSHTAEASRHELLEPPVKLAFKDAVKWKQQKKAGMVLSDLPDQNLLSQLRGRDHAS